MNAVRMNAVRMRVLAVDDELPALEDLVRMLEASPAVERVESAASAEEALVALGDGAAIDAVFLDVRMPGLGGLELARVLRRFERSPAIVFVSAFDDAAVHAFEVAAVDFLVKPVSRRRLDEAIERAGRRSAPDEPAAAEDDETLAVDALRGGGTRLLARSSVLYLQAHGDYVRVASTEGRYLMRARLSDLEERWAAHSFVRVHRGFLVNLRRAVEVRPRLNGTAVLVMADGAEVPIARRQVGELRRKLGV
jgi:DNA-binding LytR/AlgR family response regulator